MLKSLRVRTEIGVDKEITLDLNQDFDLLEILSLRLHQTDVYPKDCSDYGVVCGRVLVNGGFGLPNAKISVFVPLDDKDGENPVISALYPYKTQNYRNEEGYRYNLLSSVPNYKGHQHTGSFPAIDDALLNQEVSYVYDKYYKYTAKTNDSGDFMIYGVPLGEHTLVMNLDLSDIGCFSMVPEDFKIQGEPDSSFNGAEFNTDSNLDALPQIVMLSKSVDIKPLWGDVESGCGATITRTDFDLRESGSVEIKPTAVFMGSLVTDTERSSVNKNCKPKRDMGELCNLSPAQGSLESIRYTPYFKEDVRPSGYTNMPSQTELVPVLERYDINGGYTIDENGAFLVNVPMNLEFVITNEFGEQEISKKPGVGIPTKGKYRFRIKPLETTGSARQRKRGAFLVPQIKEHAIFGVDFANTFPYNILGITPGQTTITDEKTYAFSVNYYDYAEAAVDSGDILSCNDVFYEFNYSKVYTLTSFHNHWKHRAKDGFIGIKEISPRQEESCAGQAAPFPINSANKNVNFAIVMNQFVTRMLQGLYTMLYFVMVLVCTIVAIIMIIVDVIYGIIMVIICVLCNVIYVWSRRKRKSKCNCGTCPCKQIGGLGISCNDIFGCLFLRLTKYPECDKCGCFSSAKSGSANQDCCGGLSGCDDEGNDDNDFLECNSPTNTDKALKSGCYSIDWDNIFSAISSIFSSEPTKIAMIIDWRKRENLFRSMCDGLMNYFWSNNYVGGVLYAFQFRAKIRPSQIEGKYRSQHCEEVVFFHTKDQQYYYRCTPYEYDYATGLGTFRGSTFLDVSRPPLVSFLLGGPIGLLANVANGAEKAAGANTRNLHWPTTIMDLGPVKTNIGEVCTNEGGASESCSVAPSIATTTFNSAGDFLFDSINEIVNFNSGFFDSISLRTPFKRNESASEAGRRRELNGGMASILSQFNEIGVVEYETPDTAEVKYFASLCNVPDCNPATTYTAENMGWDYAPAGGNTHPGGGGATMWDTSWPSDAIIQPGQAQFQNGWQFAGQSTWIGRSVSVPGGDDSVELVPRLASGDTINPSAEHFRQCIVEVNNNTSQIVPFFPWDKNGPGLGSNQTEYGDFATSENEIAFGNIQDIFTWQTQGGSPLPTTPITVNQTSPILSLGMGYHYYFGLIPGATSYDTFVRKYVPLVKEQTDDYVVL